MKDGTGTDHCQACGIDVDGVRPSWRARAGFYLAASTTVVVVTALPLLGIMLLFASPIAILAGIGIGPAATAAFRPPTCPRCGRLVRVRSSETSPRLSPGERLEAARR